MDDQPHNGEAGFLSVQLEVHLDAQPVHGSLVTESGARQPFVGWLGFIGALTRLHEEQAKAVGKEPS
jgi:hypothetical protein